MKKEKLIKELLSNFKVPEVKSETEIWSELSQKINLEAEVISMKKKSIFSRAIPFVAAASVVLAVMFLFPSSELTSFENTSKETVVKNLPDGSSVILSPNSILTYEKTSDSREINLEGEAFFDVKKGQPFNIHTDEGEVQVLGTSFYVTEREDLLDVKCFTGKVKVRISNKAYVLTKGEGVTNISSEKYAHTSVKKFQNNKLNFDNVPLNIVLADLKLYGDFDIKNTSDLNPMITMHLETENNEDIVSIISAISKLNAKKVGDSSFELY